MFDQGHDPCSSEPLCQGGTRAAQPRKPVLIVLHQEHSTAGRVGRLLQAQGYRLDIRRPRFGDPLPDTMRDHAGAAIFGGPMSANDPDAYIMTEIDWIKVPLRENAPLLGICLGAQMLAAHLGQPVYSHPKGLVEIGYYPITPTPAAETLFGDTFPRRVYQWHREGFDAPKDSVLLATGLDFECQAFCLGKAFAIQFHPEVTYAMMCKWNVLGAHKMDAPGARRGHLEDWFEHDGAVARWTEAFLTSWAAGGGVSARPPERMPIEHAFPEGGPAPSAVIP